MSEDWAERLAEIRATQDEPGYEGATIKKEWGGATDAIQRQIDASGSNTQGSGTEASHAPGTTVPSEHEEQAELVRWAKENEEAIDGLDMLYAIPNGGYRTAGEAGKFKAEGVKAGYPDIAIDKPVQYVKSVYPMRLAWFHGLRIEMKRTDRKNEKDGGLSPNQIAWIDKLRRRGYYCAVCYGAEEAKDVALRYLAGAVQPDDNAGKSPKAGFDALRQEYGDKFSQIKDVDAWCREIRSGAVQPDD